MPEKLDNETRISKLRALGILDRFPDLIVVAAVADAEKAADLEIATFEAAERAAREEKRLAETPREIPWAATPRAADDIVLLCPERRPHQFTPVEINGQLYTPALPNRSIGFLEAALRPTLPKAGGIGYSFGTVRTAVFLWEALGGPQASAVVARLTSDQVAILICIYRAHAHSTRPDAKHLAALAHTQLVQFGHALGSTSYIPNGARAEWDRDEAEAAAIWAMATGDAPAVEEADRDTEQRREAGAQVSRVNDARSARADRDAARAVILEAAEDAKFADAVKAAAGGS
jgi:hypothetical protein